MELYSWAVMYNDKSILWGFIFCIIFESSNVYKSIAGKSKIRKCSLHFVVFDFYL